MPLRTLEQIIALESPENRVVTAEAMLLGVAGFLPLSPTISDYLQYDPARIHQIEQIWTSRGGAWHGFHLSPAAWSGARVRPANHPVIRLSGAAAMVGGCDSGLTQVVADVLQSEDSVDTLSQLATSSIDIRRRLGKGRSSAILTNVFLPFVLASFAGSDIDDSLADRASFLWESLPVAESNSISNRAMRQVGGPHSLPRLGVRGQQGLLYLDRELCTPRRCFECPIAHLVLHCGNFPVARSEARGGDDLEYSQNDSGGSG
jgi:Protein of unknown function (DUF2851)